jgi:RND family efflux transporter MFP subunit
MRPPRPALAVLTLALALGGCGGREPPPARPEAAATGPRLVVRRAPVADSKVVAATVETRDQAEARARIGGTLVSLAVREGDSVRRGQVIARVVDARLGYQTRAADAQVAAAAAEATRAQAELSRTARLYESGIYAKARLEQVEAQAKAAQGALSAARAERAASAELADQGAIVAPSEGRVLRADVPAGAVVGQGQTVAVITSGPPVLRIEVPEAEARALRVGQPVAVVAADLQGAGPGTVSQVYPAITAGRVMADVTVPGLKPEFIGQRVRVRLQVGQRSALTIPRTYVAHRYGLDYVRLVDRHGRPSEIAVQLAPVDGDQGRVEVLSGLADGDTLVPPGA